MAFQFKIQLKNISDPPVWRRVTVPEQFTFMRLHYTIQAAFGWGNDHLFQFSPKGYSSQPVIGIPMEEDNFLFRDEKKMDAEEVKLAEIFKTPKQKFTYIYDFGDDWIHELLLEKITDEKILRAACTDGKGVCPPEDCGGPWGFANLKEILSDTKHPKHYETKGWLGLSKKDKWDAEAFDMEGTNERVNKV